MITPRPEKGPQNVTNEGVESQLWRRVLAIANTYEESWYLDRSIDPVEFAKRHSDIPHDILSQELARLRDELVTYQTESVAPTQVPHRFSIIETLRSGGMGVVYLAYDHDCNRQVAVKKIRPEFRNDPLVVRRFHAEAELTAGLEHPGIIPIYARGVDSKGEDFYAMRLIRQGGASTLAMAIHEFHDSLSPATRPEQEHPADRLDRFRQLVRTLVNVADTIAYTHSHGIVHRDLKPANILLGPYGETLIADWGLAKRIDAPLGNDLSDPSGNSTSPLNHNPNESTSSTTGVGTPGYAAPEMSLGIESSAIRLADIYSLGAILHCILHGSSPIEHSQDSIGNRKNITKLGRGCPTISYLEAIAHKAMANDLTQRYVSAQELRMDLQNWIAGDPISAQREGYWEQAIRWPSRHRASATGLASALAITFLAGSCFLWYQSAQKSVLNRQAKQLQLALDDSARLLNETRDAKTLAEQANQDAQEARKLAVERKEVAQKREGLAFEGLLRFQDILLTNQAAFQSEKIYGVQEQLVTQMKETFVGILDNLSGNVLPQPQTLRYLQVLTHRLAAMERLDGRSDQALVAIDQACAWMQRCLGIPELPDEIEADLRRRIGELRSLQGNMAIQSNKVTEAIPAVEESITLLAGLVKSDRLGIEDKKEAVAALVQSYTAHASIKQIQGEIDKAKEDQLRALELLDLFHPNTFAAAMASAQANYGMAFLHIQSQEPEQAIEQFERTSGALVLAEKFSQKALPLEFLVYRSQLAYNRSNLLVSQNQPLLAIEILKQQLQLDTQAVSDFPSNPIILEAYERTANFLQGLYVQTGRQSEAVDVCRTWIETAEKLVFDHPQSEPAIHCAVQANHFAGHLDQQMNYSDVAQDRYRKALLMYQQAAEAQITSTRLVYQKVELEMHLLQLHYLLGSEDQAESIFERAMEAAQRLKAVTQPVNQELTSAIHQLQRGIDAMRTANDQELANTSEAKLKSVGLWLAR
jgi:serine/threonine protein kinase/tetratricopeptide (TPR) repeat protein